jgi:hypothetical protein
MARFHFDLHADGKITPDTAGLELQDVGTAERYARDTLANLTSALLQSGVDFERSIEIRTNNTPVARMVVKSRMHRF